MDAARFKKLSPEARSAVIAWLEREGFDATLVAEYIRLSNDSILMNLIDPGTRRTYPLIAAVDDPPPHY